MCVLVREQRVMQELILQLPAVGVGPRGPHIPPNEPERKIEWEPSIFITLQVEALFGDGHILQVGPQVLVVDEHLDGVVRDSLHQRRQRELGEPFGLT